MMSQLAVCAALSLVKCVVSARHTEILKIAPELLLLAVGTCRGLRTAEGTTGLDLPDPLYLLLSSLHVSAACSDTFPPQRGLQNDPLSLTTTNASNGVNSVISSLTLSQCIHSYTHAQGHTLMDTHTTMSVLLPPSGM